MIISAIEKQKGNDKRFNIYIDGEFVFGLDAMTVLKNHLNVGMQADAEFLEKLKALDTAHKTNEKALTFLSYGRHSKQGLFKKLENAGFDCDAITSTVDKLEKYKMIDDESLADDLCEYYYQKKLYGKNRVILELLKKGIEKNLAKQSAEENLPDDISKSIAALIEKKCKNNKMDKKKKESLIRFLLNYGHEISDIKMVFNDFFE